MPEDFDLHRTQFAISLFNTAESLRQAAERAENFAKVVQGGIWTGGNVHPQDGATKRKRKLLKDPNAPKRPASSYIMFQNEVRKKLREKHPDLNNQELMSLIGKMWAEMAEKDKAIYHNAAATAKEQYSQEKQAYAARSPEEIAAQDAIAHAVTKIKRPRGPKTPVTVPESPTLPVVAAAKSPSSDSSDNSESESDEEEEEEEEDERRVKKGKTLKGKVGNEENITEDEDNIRKASQAPVPMKPGKMKPIQPPGQVKKKKSSK